MFWKRGDFVRTKVIVIILIAVCVLIAILLMSVGTGIINPIGTGQQGGITDVTPRDLPDRVSFQNAYQAVNDHYLDSSSNFSVYQIQADTVTADGSAKSWLFDVNEYQNQTVTLIFDRKGLSELPQISSQKLNPINMGNIIDPQTFLDDHKSFIEDLSTSQNNSRVELVLVNNVYTISQMSNGQITDYTFDAKTGNQINNS